MTSEILFRGELSPLEKQAGLDPVRDVIQVSTGMTEIGLLRLSIERNNKLIERFSNSDFSDLSLSSRIVHAICNYREKIARYMLKGVLKDLNELLALELKIKINEQQQNLARRELKTMLNKLD